MEPVEIATGEAAGFVTSAEEYGMDRVRLAYRQVHAVKTAFLKEGVRAGLTNLVHKNARTSGYGDINTGMLHDDDLEGIGTSVGWVSAQIGLALSSTGLLGARVQPYTIQVRKRFDALACNGAPFHNDDFGHWPRCLFWVLAVDVEDVELVIQPVGAVLPLAVGDLIVFDPCLPHAVCRTGDGGKALQSSFDGVEGSRGVQAFIGGELVLSDARWKALGCPWRQAGHKQFVGFKDLHGATFDEETGAVLEAKTLEVA